MTSAGDPFGRLPRNLRTRLDAFSAQIDAVTIDDLQLLVVRRTDGAHDDALRRAGDLAQRTSRTTAIDAIRDIAIDYIARRYSQRFQDPRRPFLGAGIALQASGDERGRVATSFEDALTAIALSDVLDPADVDVLLGPWAGLADAAAAR